MSDAVGPYNEGTECGMKLGVVVVHAVRLETDAITTIHAALVFNLPILYPFKTTIDLRTNAGPNR